VAARILVVEDNKLNMQLVSDLLTVHGYEVVQASTGDQALQLARLHRPDLILMDISLKGMTGLEITHELRQNPHTAHIRILAVTAYAGEEDRRRALLAGCDGFVSKPIDTRQLPRIIAEHLKGESAHGRVGGPADPHR